jgi:hypothetical protein
MGAGGEQAVSVAALHGLPFWRRCNRHLHHRHDGALGNGRYRPSDSNTDASRETLAPWRVTCPRLAVSTVRASKAGFEPAFSGETMYPISSPPASVEPRISRGKPNSSAALSTRRHLQALWGLLCHRCPAHRLVPSGRPRALGHARFRASPGIRVSRSGFRRDISNVAPDNKKPSGTIGSGGFAGKSGSSISPIRDRSHEPCMRCRSAQSRLTVGRAFRVRGSSRNSCFAHEHHAREAAGNTPAPQNCQGKEHFVIASAFGIS